MDLSKTLIPFVLAAKEFERIIIEEKKKRFKELTSGQIQLKADRQGRNLVFYLKLPAYLIKREYYSLLVANKSKLLVPLSPYSSYAKQREKQYYGTTYESWAKTRRAGQSLTYQAFMVSRGSGSLKFFAPPDTVTWKSKVVVNKERYKWLSKSIKKMYNLHPSLTSIFLDGLARKKLSEKVTAKRDFL